MWFTRDNSSWDETISGLFRAIGENMGREEKEAIMDGKPVYFRFDDGHVRMTADIRDPAMMDDLVITLEIAYGKAKRIEGKKIAAYF
jgi:hypothetical protein